MSREFSPACAPSMTTDPRDIVGLRRENIGGAKGTHSKEARATFRRPSQFDATETYRCRVADDAGLRVQYKNPPPLRCGIFLVVASSRPTTKACWRHPPDGSRRMPRICRGSTDPKYGRALSLDKPNLPRRRWTARTPGGPRDGNTQRHTTPRAGSAGIVGACATGRGDTPAVSAPSCAGSESAALRRP